MSGVQCVQVYRHCSHIDISGLKDPRLHEQTMTSALYNLGRLLDDDGRHQVLLLYLLTYTLFAYLCWSLGFLLLSLFS